MKPIKVTTKDEDLTPAERKEKEVLLKIKNVMRGTVIDDARINLKTRNILSLHGIGDADELLFIDADKFLSLWGLGWAAWRQVVEYKRVRGREDSIDYIEHSLRRNRSK